MNISQALTSAYQKLIKAKINSAHLDAELLLSFTIKKSREYILAHPEKSLTKNQTNKFQNLITQRAKNIPIAYLTNSKEFYGRTFYVDERVLVPRPETEQIIDITKRILRNPIPLKGIGFPNKRTIIADIGTGSGCIITTMACELKNKNIKYFAIDISKDALAVARKNARLHGVDKKIKFLQGNLLEPFLKKSKLVIGHWSLVIVANLPYLTPTEIKNSPSIKHEPRLALTAGKDGLKYYRELAKQIKELIKINPKLNITLLCEIGDKQANGMKKIFSPEKITIKKDLAGLDRVAVVTSPALRAPSPCKGEGM